MTSWALQDMRHAITTMMPDLRRYARSLTRSADAADDLVQTAYERVLTRQVSLESIEQPASWMRCIIRNLWVDQKRSSRERLSAPLEDGEHIGTEETERTLIARSTLMRVREVMAALPEEQRAPIMLVCVEGFSYQEAAAELNIPIGTLMSRLARGRLELARRVGLAK
ncbi:RNA polymerase sigma factor [Skermanella mucosa]|uniref:RNA polymerase sigma factor n=1 Tax=Skermanella mucosa TaxID=1789672 RepID=UPI00192B6987|nr:RNA polymerase sigma factor [Skermanella mucosa]UEM18932.1 RNA polymerase sigma factor [Skermanella mucosa]